jgi:ASC-1-like (ASCH) protein/ribosomal protein S18 acetylase RimI-like enzyme
VPEPGRNGDGVFTHDRTARTRFRLYCRQNGRPNRVDERYSIEIREATEDDRDFVVSLMSEALSPYYDGDHEAHADRILNTHFTGGRDSIGYFSYEQKMYIATVDSNRAGMLHLVGKRQGTFKISPIIVARQYRGHAPVGRSLLSFAERYARARDARQLYCTVAKENKTALRFFLANGFVVAGTSHSHYKVGVTEVMLYKQFYATAEYDRFDRQNISVVPFAHVHEPQVRNLLLRTLPRDFHSVDDAWVNALFDGYQRRETRDVNKKFKLIFVAVDRAGHVLGVAGATPKKGSPIKIMPFIARSLPAFVALLTDVPFELRTFGHKLYLHISPTATQVMALQQRGWRLDAAFPAAYHPRRTTQQWSLNIQPEVVMLRPIRVKQRFLDLIRSGKKTLEVRVAYKWIREIEPGDHILLESRDQRQIIVVREVRRYRSFLDMVRVEDPTRIAPDIPVDEVLPLLRRIYPPDREKLGVVVLDIAVDNTVPLPARAFK